MNAARRRARISIPFISLLALFLVTLPSLAFTPSGLLEIHHINVQQGDCTLIIGPDGTTFLIDAGNTGKGNNEVAPYLQNEVGLLPADGIDYMLATHRHADHLGGLDEVINNGYDVHNNCWDNGSSYTSGSVTDYLNAAATTTAGPVTEMPLGTVIQLGDGATATAVVVDGNVLGHGYVTGATSDENDRSVAILIQYNDFDYLTAGDMGGGDDDFACTGRETGQVNIESPLANSLMPGGGAALLTSDGVEVLHVNHHGSESSMNSDYMNSLTPAVGVIAVGAGQSSTWHHPRTDVVDGVLLAQASCVTADPALVLQTEEGQPTGTYTSYSGYCCGDIVMTTTGLGSYSVDATGAVSQGPDERSAAGLPAVIAMDGGGVTPPVAAFVGSPTSGCASLLVDFTDQSTGDITDWSWDFGDGIGTSTQQNPSYTYDDPGLYTVTLSVTGPGGSDDEIKTDYITVTDCGGTVIARANGETTLIGTATGDYSDTFASDGIYEVITEETYTGHPKKRYSYCEHHWDFTVSSGSAIDFYVEAYRPNNGDGDDFAFEYSTDGAIWNPLVTVASATEQVYSASMPPGLSGPVTVRVTDTDRNWGATSNDPVYVDDMYIEIASSGPQPPVAAFAGTPTSGTAPLTVDFTDLSTGSPTSWSWDFGDGIGTSSDPNPSYTYNDIGTYTVSLTVANAYGSDDEIKIDFVSVTETGNTMYVYDIVVTRARVGPNTVGVGTITIWDNNSNPVAGATVDATATGPVPGSFSDATGPDGTVTFQTGGMKKPSGEWCFEVTNVTHATLTYDPGSNNVTQSCESGDVYRIASNKSQQAPLRFGIDNYPNPFNPSTTIAFRLPAASQVRITVFDLRGRKVTTLADGHFGPGTHTVEWHARDCASGNYFYRIQAGDMVETRSMTLLK